MIMIGVVKTAEVNVTTSFAQNETRSLARKDLE